MPPPPAPHTRKDLPAAHLLVDWGEKALAAWLVDGSGTVFPCSATFRGRTWRYFSTSVWVDLDKAGISNPGGTESFSENVLRFMSRGGRDWSEIGWVRPWELDGEQDAIPVSEFLEALGCTAGSPDPSTTRWLRRAAGAMAGFILEPLFAFLNVHGQAPGGVDVLLALPGRLGRQAQLLLRALLGRQGFRSIRLVDRVMAAALGGLDRASPAREVWVADILYTRCYLHQVRRFIDGDSVRLESGACREVPLLGWEFIVRSCMAGLRASDTPAGDADTWTPTERLLLGAMGLGFTPPAGRRPLTRAKFGALFESLVMPSLDAQEIAPLSDSPGDVSRVLVPLGEVFLLGELERYLHARLACPPAAWARDCLPPDRALYGLLGILKRLSARGEGEVVLRRSPALRIGTAHGQSTVLVPSSEMPLPGETRVFHQTLAPASADGVREGRMPLVFRCGESPRPRACFPAGLLSIPVREDDFGQERPLRLELQLSCPKSGGRLRGTVRAELGDRFSEGTLDFPETCFRLTTGTPSEERRD